MFKKFWEWWLGVTHHIHTWMFWLLVFFLIGHFTGQYMSNKVLDIRIKDAAKLGGIVIDDVPYNIMKR